MRSGEQDAPSRTNPVRPTSRWRKGKKARRLGRVRDGERDNKSGVVDPTNRSQSLQAAIQLPHSAFGQTPNRTVPTAPFYSRLISFFISFL